MEVGDARVIIGCDDAEATGLVARHIAYGDGDIGAGCLVLANHRAIVLLVDMVARKNHQRLGVGFDDKVAILVEGVGGTALPALIAAPAVGLPDMNATVGAVKIPGPTTADVLVQ